MVNYGILLAYVTVNVQKRPYLSEFQQQVVHRDYNPSVMWMC